MTANDIARAICAAAKETGANPIDVALGNERAPGCVGERSYVISRARYYAGGALDRVLNRPIITVERPLIAKLIGVNEPSYNSFFPSWENRRLAWWSEEAFQRVISAVEAGWVRPKLETAPAAKPEPPVISPGQRFRHMPPTKAQIGILERDGFRPAPDVAKRVTEDDKRSRGYVPVGPPIKKDDFLRRAVENTQKLTPPSED